MHLLKIVCLHLFLSLPGGSWRERDAVPLAFPIQRGPSYPCQSALVGPVLHSLFTWRSSWLFIAAWSYPHCPQLGPVLLVGSGESWPQGRSAFPVAAPVSVGNHFCCKGAPPLKLVLNWLCMGLPRSSSAQLWPWPRVIPLLQDLLFAPEADRICVCLYFYQPVKILLNTSPTPSVLTALSWPQTCWKCIQSHHPSP